MTCQNYHSVFDPLPPEEEEKLAKLRKTLAEAKRQMLEAKEVLPVDDDASPKVD